MGMVFDIVLPVFLIIFAGWFSCFKGVLTADSVKALNQYVLHFAVPPMLFLGTSRVAFEEAVNSDFIIAFFLASILTMAVGVYGYRGVAPKGSLDATVLALICGWGNTMYMGVPLAFYLFGEKGTLPVIIATLSTNSVFILALSLLSGRSAEHSSPFQKALKAFSLFVKNPVLMAPICGFFVSYNDIAVPSSVLNLLTMLAPSAAPVALFALGASLSGLRLSGELDQLAWVCIVKCVISPLIALLIALALGLQGFWAASVVLMSLLPTGSMVFVFAKQYETRVSLASSAIFLTTGFSLLTLALSLPLLAAWAG